MTTIEKVLDNAFKIKRQSSKYRKEFICNYFERPVTHLELFQHLATSNINLNNFDLQKVMCNKFANNYFQDFNSDVILRVTRKSATILFAKSDIIEPISLDFDKFTKSFNWFLDEEIFSTDYGSLVHSNNYYITDNVKNNEQWKLLVILLKKIAENKGVTQNQIAERTGLLQSNVSRLFSLKYKPNIDTFLEIAKAININFFFEDKDEKTDLGILLEKAMDELNYR